MDNRDSDNRGPTVSGNPCQDVECYNCERQKPNCSSMPKPYCYKKLYSVTEHDSSADFFHWYGTIWQYTSPDWKQNPCESPKNAIQVHNAMPSPSNINFIIIFGWLIYYSYLTVW